MEYVFVIARDEFLRREYYTGMKLVNDPALIERTLVMLHRSTSSTMYKTVDELPDGIDEPYSSDFAEQINR